MPRTITDVIKGWRAGVISATEAMQEIAATVAFVDRVPEVPALRREVERLLDKLAETSPDGPGLNLPPAKLAEVMVGSGYIKGFTPAAVAPYVAEWKLGRAQKMRERGADA